MIPPLSIDVYPPNTLEGMIAREWVSCIAECDCPLSNPEEPFQILFRCARELMVKANWPPTYQHKFLNQLRRDLPELTHCHPVTRQFIELLDRELESN